MKGTGVVKDLIVQVKAVITDLIQHFTVQAEVQQPHSSISKQQPAKQEAQERDKERGRNEKKKISGG